MNELAILAAFPLLMIGAGVGDCLTYKIPNWLCGLIAALFFPAALYTGMPLAEIGWHALAAAIVLVVCFIMFSFGCFGGGDAKLLSVAALWIGFSPLLPFVVMVALFGGALAIIMKTWWIVKLQIEKLGYSRISEKVTTSPQLPYGIAIAAGALFAFPKSWIYQAANGPALF